tara:strand:+ start:61 stop:324 length:264 start_codon:yes stop_codon:yes gene_type:complete
MIGLAFKLLTPKVLKGIIKYVFEENELDKKCNKFEQKLREYEQKLTDQGHKMTLLVDMIKARDESIDKLEEFEKQVRRKKAFKRKDG